MVRGKTTILTGDAATVMSGMDAGSINCVITSPPYFGRIGRELNPSTYHDSTIEVVGPCLFGVQE